MDRLESEMSLSLPVFLCALHGASPTFAGGGFILCSQQVLKVHVVSPKGKQLHFRRNRV